jgi:predicted MPP superfamily phosphohydrolase
VTNCDLPRTQAKGLSEHDGSVLHVSAGLGTSPYAPVRFACRPEATLLTLTARS